MESIHRLTSAWRDPRVSFGFSKFLRNAAFGGGGGGGFGGHRLLDSRQVHGCELLCFAWPNTQPYLDSLIRVLVIEASFEKLVVRDRESGSLYGRRVRSSRLVESPLCWLLGCRVRGGRSGLEMSASAASACVCHWQSDSLEAEAGGESLCRRTKRFANSMLQSSPLPSLLELFVSA